MSMQFRELAAQAAADGAISADEAVIEMAGETDEPLPEIRVPPPPRLLGSRLLDGTD